MQKACENGWVFPLADNINIHPSLFDDMIKKCRATEPKRTHQLIEKIVKNPKCTPKKVLDLYKNVQTLAPDSWMGMYIKATLMESPKMDAKVRHRCISDFCKVHQRIDWPAGTTREQQESFREQYAGRAGIQLQDKEVVQAAMNNPKTSDRWLKDVMYKKAQGTDGYYRPAYDYETIDMAKRALEHHQAYRESDKSEEDKIETQQKNILRWVKDKPKRDALASVGIDLTKLSPELREKIKDWDMEDIKKFLGWLKRHKGNGGGVVIPEQEEQTAL